MNPTLRNAATILLVVPPGDPYELLVWPAPQTARRAPEAEAWTFDDASSRLPGRDDERALVVLRDGCPQDEALDRIARRVHEHGTETTWYSWPEWFWYESKADWIEHCAFLMGSEIIAL